MFELSEDGRAAATEASERVGPGPWTGEDGHQSEIREAMKSLVLAIRQTATVGTGEQLAAAIGVITEARQRIYQILASLPPSDNATAKSEKGESEA